MSTLSMRTILAILSTLTILLGPSMAHALGPLDMESVECLSCHDAALAVDASIITVCSDPDCDHPIGVNYPILSATNGGLNPIHTLDPAIKLAGGGNIGCTSCHVPYSSQNHTLLSSMRTTDPQTPDPMLAVSNIGSALCFECHRK